MTKRWPRGSWVSVLPIGRGEIKAFIQINASKTLKWNNHNDCWYISKIIHHLQQKEKTSFEPTIATHPPHSPLDNRKLLQVRAWHYLPTNKGPINLLPSTVAYIERVPRCLLMMGFNIYPSTCRPPPHCTLSKAIRIGLLEIISSEDLEWDQSPTHTECIISIFGLSFQSMDCSCIKYKNGYPSSTTTNNNPRSSTCNV